MLASVATTLAGCSNERPPVPRSTDASDRGPRAPVVEAPRRFETAAPYRARLPHGAELYLPPWFLPRQAGYDLVVHFHGLGKLQEHNLESSQLNAAVVTVNLGVSTDVYANAFRDPRSFTRLVAEAEEEIERSGRAHDGRLRRVALSAWSAGFASLSKVMAAPASAERIDAVLVADGFFTSLTHVKKRTVNAPSLERYARLAAAAMNGDKLFAITHTTIPTVDYASTEETAAKLLEMTSTAKTPARTIGPHEMVQLYVAERGSFHVKGYEGVTASAHVKQITAMGETLYPYLKARWEEAPGADADAGAGTGAPARTTSPR